MEAKWSEWVVAQHSPCVNKDISSPRPAGNATGGLSTLDETVTAFRVHGMFDLM